MIMSFFLLAVGIITWPILEYCLHRFSGHKFRMPKAFFVEHQTHHAEKDYFAPPWKKLLAAIGFLSILTVLNMLWLKWYQALIFSGGFISMYLFYEWTHYSFHKYEPRTDLGLTLRKHHFSHHFINPHHNHGVTSTIADQLFGTYRKAEKVPVPRRFAMNWLFAPNGSVKEKYQMHFEIKG